MLGVRAPSFVVSPYVSAGSACHDVIDHTSILKTPDDFRTALRHAMKPKRR
jgi:phospholipase C